jgi:hypothetical protein
MTTFQRPGTTSLAGAAPMSVLTWRRQRLLEVGFPWALADQLAHGRVDLHEILALVDRGCPPELAAAILKPIETQDRSGTQP